MTPRAHCTSKPLASPLKQTLSPLKKTLLSTCLLAGTAAISSAAAQTLPVFPDSDYSDQVATVEDILGYPLASKVSTPEAIQRYYQHLADQHPDRIRLLPYATSWEGRQLFYVVISSAENLGQLDQFESNMRQLADPRQLNDDDAESLIEQTPASIWIANSVHGNEISPAEASMATAYHLLADQSERTASLLDETLIYIDPMQNPDGRARFVSRYYATVGLNPSTDRISAEHNEPWPNGRTNHYLFDMNRDWLALTQPETRGRIDALLNSYPLIFIDSHEMGGDLPYYFSPEAHPFNPHITEPQREVLEWVGRSNAGWFDDFGYDYFTREIFDAFYPGYGASWPLYQGAISMTYEMGSARGHHFRTRDGEVLTYGDGVQQNFVAFMSSIELAAERGDELQQRFYQYRKNAIEQGSRGDVRSYVFPATRDAAGHQKLAAVLSEQGIEVKVADEGFSACGTDYQAGAYIVNAAQPTYHLIRTLLDENVPMDEDFIEEQERLRANNLPDQIYDVTAWSLPLMFNLDVEACASAPRVASTTFSGERIAAGSVENPDAEYGYIVPWGDMNAVRFLSAAIQQGLRVRSSDLEFIHDSKARFPSGSLVLSRAGNPDDLTEVVTQLASDTGAEVTGIDSSWMRQGPNVGSANVKTMHAPNIAMAWDEPTNVLSAGSTRFVIEREGNYPVTAIRPAQLRSADLSRYQVLILPATASGDYSQAFGEQGSEHIRRWVENGGVLITLGNATRFVVDGENPMLNSAVENKVQPEEVARINRDTAELITNDAQLNHRIQDHEAAPDWVSGVLARVNVDQEHWLTAGVPEQVHSLFVGRDIYSPLTINHGRNVAYFAGPDEVLASGYLWQENREQIAYKPLVMVQPQGRGMVISFTQEPNYRAYMDGMQVLLFNAIFRGAAHAQPTR
ncbi:peptidase M14 [Aliidiomarina sedimenti]|uniref:Peptidase M14 n=1 Tax=Aliidiomarina sedimenti TaxID=1933879 RepID=A0ABY0C1V8_9GAMM|nr:M14 family metallopeptidase [Aliidiomarina sedimenti]RUO31842.1 peptidase M14 [Aliidiomarina sedimenti]